MVFDKYKNKVKAGDIIKPERMNVTYKVIEENGILGVYEYDEFIALKDILRNYKIVNR